MEKEEEQKVSKFSGAVSALIRVDELWNDTHTHSRQGKYLNWNEDLDRIWLELAKDLSNEIFTSKKEIFDAFETQLKEKGGIYDKAKCDFEDIPQDTITKRSNIYKILMDKELFLRRLENELGKGTSWEDEDEDDFD